MSELGSNGAAQLKGILMKIGSLISGKKVAVISPSASAHDLVGALSSHHVGALVVSSDGKKIEGYITHIDFGSTLNGPIEWNIGFITRNNSFDWSEELR